MKNELISKHRGLVLSFYSNYSTWFLRIEDTDQWSQRVKISGEYGFMPKERLICQLTSIPLFLALLAIFLTSPNFRPKQKETMKLWNVKNKPKFDTDNFCSKNSFRLFTILHTTSMALI